MNISSINVHLCHVSIGRINGNEIFVSQVNGTDNENCGAKAYPCRSIPYTINHIVYNNDYIKLTPAIHMFNETVKIRFNVSLFGSNNINQPSVIVAEHGIDYLFTNQYTTYYFSLQIKNITIKNVNIFLNDPQVDLKEAFNGALTEHYLSKTVK